MIGRFRQAGCLAAPIMGSGKRGRNLGVLHNSWAWLDGFAGVSRKGLFDTTPDWVDIQQAPGTSSQTTTLGLATTIRNVTRLNYFFWSPNLVWFAMALSVHAFFPYDIAAAREGIALEWLARRFLLNYLVAFTYYGFFFFGLYVRSWSPRKYQGGVFPTLGNMAHNLWYWSLAIVQWTFWEAVMARLWASGAVSFSTNAEVLANPKLLALNVLWVLMIPLWRDLHFYIAHRFIHIRAVYKYVHSLHHRNADPEPFSGMTMHPVEHLYYFSNAFTPSLYLNLSPLIFLWNFLHLTIAPGAGHSGFEDHFQADQYHYVHHAKFECNYGSPLSAFIDQFCGTFREKLGESKEYQGEFSGQYNETEHTRKASWSPQGYLGLPASADHALYTIYWMALFVLVPWAVVFNQGPGRVSEIAGVPIATAVGIITAYSPPVVAMLLCSAFRDRMSWRWPFHKEALVGTLGVFITLGWLACILPVYHATTWVVQSQSP